MESLLGGKYVLDRRLGGGGMAEVFLGHAIGAEGFRRQVAIKRVLPGYAQSPQFAEMFISEARLSSQLQHSNIVAILDFARDQDSGLFLVMEYVDGASLDQVLQTGPLPVPAVVHVVTEVLRGLEYAHDTIMPQGVRGIVHRDVSPHNVLLSHDGGVKIADFGIAKALITSNVTGSEMIKGKPAYMSPEQANGDPLDGRSDLFAVGVMLWEMLCGRQLFVGASIQETLSRLLFAPIPSPRQMRPDVPPDLEHVTMRLLARELPQRYQTATEVMVDLIACRDYPRSGRELLRGLMKTRLVGDSDAGLSSVRTAVDPRRPLPSPSDGRSPQGESTHDRRRSSRSVLLVILAVGILGAAMGLFIASRVNPPVRIVASAQPDADTAGPQVVTDANLEHSAPDAPTEANVVDGSVQPHPEAQPASSPTKIAKRATVKEAVREPLKASTVEEAATPARPPPPPSSPPSAAKGATKLDEDFAKIEKMGISLDFKKVWSHKAPVDFAAVIKYWVGKAPQFRRCYIEGLKALRVESDSGELVWMYGGSAISYEIDAQGVVTDVRGFSWIHDEIKQCMERFFTRATGIPRPASGFAMITVDVDMTTCNAVWEQDDKARKQRRRCPVTTMSAVGTSN